MFVSKSIMLHQSPLSAAKMMINQSKLPSLFKPWLFVLNNSFLWENPLSILRYNTWARLTANITVCHYGGLQFGLCFGVPSHICGVSCWFHFRGIIFVHVFHRAGIVRLQQGHLATGICVTPTGRLMAHATRYASHPPYWLTRQLHSR